MKPFETTVDLRSDTVTQPSPEMRAAMAQAKVGDDVYGEDPAINALENKVAGLFGFESALFTPTGTMANQIAIHLHTKPGDTILAEEQSHVYLYEVGASAAMSGVQYDLIPFSEGFSDSAIDKFYKPDSPYGSNTTLLVIENTHNRGEGKFFTPDQVKRIGAKGHQLKMAVHCDGARLWNAAVASQVELKSLGIMAQNCDTLSVCFSKGLGAPVGSALLCTKDFSVRARRIRKRWGGGMRQAGILAAAANFALDFNFQRLHEDHQNMRMLANGIKELDASESFLKISLPIHNTNIAYLDFPRGGCQMFWQKLEANGVKTHILGPERIRILTHLHIRKKDVEYVISTVASAYKTLRAEIL